MNLFFAVFESKRGKHSALEIKAPNETSCVKFIEWIKVKEIEAEKEIGKVVVLNCKIIKE